MPWAWVANKHALDMCLKIDARKEEVSSVSQL